MEVLQVNIPAPISYVQSNKPGITVAINFIDSADHVVIEQVKTNDLQDRRLIVKNSEGVQIFTLVRGPKNQMNQTFVATLFNMAGEQVMCIDHKPINPFVLGCCCMCIVCSFGCCNQLVPVSDIQCPVGNSLGILKQSGGPTGPRTFATDNNGVKFSFNHGCCFQDQSEFQIYTSNDIVANLIREHTVNLEVNAYASVFPDHYKLAFMPGSGSHNRRFVFGSVLAFYVSLLAKPEQIIVRQGGGRRRRRRR